jgi:hypothetical protein
LAGTHSLPNPNQSAKIRMVSGIVSDFNRCVGVQSDLCEGAGTNLDSGKRKLELTEVLRSYAGGAANCAPHRAERGPYTGRGCEHGGAVRRDRTRNL